MNCLQVGGNGISIWRGIGFEPTQYDPHVYMRSNKYSSGYDYLGCHTDDITVVAKDAQAIIDQLMRSYEITKPGLPMYHLDCNYSKEVVEGREMWHIGLDTHVQEAIKKAEDLLGTYFDNGDYSLPKNSKKDKKVPMAPGSHPESDESGLLNEKGHSLYQELLGSLQ